MPLELTPKQPPYYTTDGEATTTNTLTDTQIKSLPTAPIAIIPAPGAGKIIVVNKAIISISTVDPYTNLDNTNNSYIDLCYGTPADEQASNTVDNLTTAFATLEANPGILLQGQPISANKTISSVMVNKAVCIEIYNDVLGNLTGGNAANTMTVTIDYKIMSI